MSWHEIEFQKFITLQRGFDLPISQMKDGDIPVLGSNCIVGYHNVAKVQPPGVVTGRSGTLGVVQFTDKVFWPHNTSLWVKDFKGNDPKFVYYKLQTLKLERFNGGASVPTLNRNVLDTLTIRIPNFSTQEKVASVLSMYDDLIENNRRRIQLLEESARLLYKEWFVHLRFPGHEHVKIINGIPEGWKRGNVGELVSINSGYAFKSSNWIDEGNPVIKIRNIIGNNDVDIENCQCINDNVAEKAAHFALNQNDLLIAMTGATIGKIGIMPRTKKTYYLNQRVGFFHDKKFQSLPFLFCIFNMEITQSQIINLSAGAAQPNISGNQIESIEILLPTNRILQFFNETLEPIFNQRLNLIEQKTKLTQARDLLLPRLMNGEIAV